MKPLRKHLKLIALLLSFAILMQSCNIYLKTQSVEQAISKRKAVKIKTINNQKYKFKRLIFEGDKLYGIAKTDSETSLLLKDKIVSLANDPTYVQIDISEIQISRVESFNFVLTFFSIPLIIFASLVGLGILAYH